MGKGYEDLEVWKISKSLAVDIYNLTDKFPSKEQFGITSQMRRAAISIASNIAEGQVRESRADFARFLAISLGSTAELKTQLLISSELCYTDKQNLQSIILKLNLVARMLKALRKSIKSN